MKVTFIGHVSKDFNIIGGRKEISPGGGVYYGAFVARSLGADVKVITKLKLEDVPIFKEMENFGIEVVWIESDNTTTMENIYPSENPDERISRMVERAGPFLKDDLKELEGVVHVSPLWRGEFPESLFEVVREKVRVLSVDAQGFLRDINEDGSIVYKDWKKKDILSTFDVLKLDISEARVMAGESDPKKALRKLHMFGVKEIVLTSSEGIYLSKYYEVSFSTFGSWSMEGRTGRGDTAIAAYLVLREKIQNSRKLTQEVARITTLKMQRKGPYRG